MAKKGGILVRNRTSTKTGKIYNEDLTQYLNTGKIPVHWNDGTKTMAKQSSVYGIGHFD